MATSGPGYTQYVDQEQWEYLQSRPTIAIPVLSTDGSRQLTSRPCILAGIGVRETSGAAAASFDLYDGSGTGGVRAASIGLVANGGVYSGISPEGPACFRGLWLQQGAGAWTGTVYVKQ